MKQDDVVKLVGFAIAGILFAVGILLFSVCAAKIWVYIFKTITLGRALVIGLVVTVVYSLLIGVSHEKG